MRAEGYLCFAGVELSNQARTATYVSEINGIPHSVTMNESCACAILDGDFVSPQADPAPWYETTRSASTDYYGFWASSITVQPTYSRSVTQVGQRRSQLGPLTSKGRIVQVSGLMLASSADGMAYGEAWLSEALAGSPCDDGGCPSDDLVILPACPGDDNYSNTAFRTLVNTGVVDGPTFASVQALPECYIQQAAFVMTSEQPWLYHAPIRQLDAELLTYGDELSAAVITPEWMGHATMRIEITNTDVEPTTDITIQGRISLDGSCPVDPPGSSVPPSWTYRIPTLAPEDKLIIDGRTQDVVLVDASEKYSSAGLSHIEFTGPFSWPDVGPCSTMCVTISGGGGDAEVTLDSYLRER